MSGRKESISEYSRRKVLQGAGAAGVAGLVFGGPSSAQSDQENESESEGEEEEVDGIAEAYGRFNVGYNNSDGADLADEVADEIQRDIEPINVMTIDAGPDDFQKLHESDDIDFVEQNRETQLDLPPQDAQGQQETDGQTVPWGIERIGALEAHEQDIRGENASVAVLDTGIDPTHEDLQENIGEGNAIIPCQGECEEEWDDDEGHGTHVAGTIAALDNEIGVLGVAPETTLHAVKVLDAGGAGTPSTIADGLVWAAQQGYDIANMSLGSASPSVTLQLAIEFAHEQGTLLVGAAGNDGISQVNFPAAYEEVIAVSATTPDDELAWFSNFGPEIELAAPGVDVLSTLPGDNYAEFSGTSMATPHVSGTGALLMALGYSAEEARGFMNETAEDLGLPSEEQGSGLVNAGAVADEPEPEPSEPVRELPRLINEAVQLIQQAVQIILSGGSLDEARRLLRDAAQLLQEAREIIHDLDESEVSEVQSELTSAEDDLVEAECLLAEEE